MGQRLELHELLVLILGSRNVYYQAPNNAGMAYPAIVYKKDDVAAEFAGNKPYLHTKLYEVTYIDSDPDSEVPDKLGVLPMCTFSRRFYMNNLNHDVFNLYF